VIATTFALGVLEPWMSGLGGGGAMVLYRAREDRYEVIDYGMRAPRSLRLEDYPLTGDGAASDIFPWPRVKDDRNIHGPGAIAVPGVVAGMEEAHRRHAKLPWKELVAPSISLAGEGLAVDWWTTLMISSGAADLRRYPASAAAYLQDGLPPNPQWGIKSNVRMPQDRLKATMAQLASAGPRDFYEGDLAQSLAAISRPPAARCRSKTSSRSVRICASRWRFPIAAARCSRRRNSPQVRRCRARSACCRRISTPRAADRMRPPTSPMPRRCRRPIANA
jgi:gamma-glutamyltranspeptidase/glutathione hydrolase